MGVQMTAAVSTGRNAVETFRQIAAAVNDAIGDIEKIGYVANPESIKITFDSAQRHYNVQVSAWQKQK